LLHAVGKPVSEKLVLLVDDDQPMRDAVSCLREVESYSILEAENGQAAVELLEKTPYLPCVILLDSTMPVMVGADFWSFGRCCARFGWSEPSGNRQSGGNR